MRHPAIGGLPWRPTGVTIGAWGSNRDGGAPVDRTADASFTRARDRVLAVTRSGPDLPTALDAALVALHEVTTFSWCALMTVDRSTMLPTSGVVEGFEAEACGPFWDNELLAPGFHKFTQLARSHDPVGTLVDATDGALTRAPIYNDLYVHLGVADELRVAFVLGSTCWGVAALVRAEADGPFPASEVDHVRHLAPHVARLLKAGVARVTAAALDTPTMVVLGADNTVQQITAGGRELLADLEHAGVDEGGVPRIVTSVATRARVSRTASHVATRVRGRSGRWVRVTAVPMADGASVAVMVEPARTEDLTPILLEAYGLTEREVEIVGLLARGLATKEIALELTLSPHTVRDHLKAIFDKADVRSRGELVAKLFAEHLLDGFHGAVHRAG